MGDQLAALLADRVGTRVLHDDADPPVDDGELAELLGRAAEVAGRVTDAIRRSDLQASLLAEGGSGADRGARKTRADQCRRAPDRRPAPPDRPGDGEVAWVDGTRRNARLRLSPIDVGPVAVGRACGARSPPC